MKKLLLFTLIAWSGLHLSAQITVTSSTFPTTGDVLRYVRAANPNIAVALFTPPGGNQFWDLSALTPASTFEVSYRPASEGGFQDAFPAATMVVSSGTSEYYYTSSGTKFELLGHVDNTIGGLPIVAIYRNQPIVAERRAPLNVFDIFQQTSNNTLQWSYGEIPAGALILPLTPDSVRLRINRQILDVVDGYGTLRLPGALPQSEFPVLRLKKTTYITQNIDIKVQLGWIDVSQAAPGSGSLWSSLLGTDTITTHHYLNCLFRSI
ncbi:MAG: hypothetical protein ACKVU2_16145 [Saprospiraceae bacterium]